MSAFERLSGTKAFSELTRSALTSGLATGTDFVVASSLAASAVPGGLATAVGYVAGGVLSFTVNRGWAFRATGRHGPQFARFLVVWLTSAGLNVAGVVFLLALFGSRFGLAWAVARTVVFVAWNFPLLRWFVFPAAPVVAERSSSR